MTDPQSAAPAAPGGGAAADITVELHMTFSGISAADWERCLPGEAESRAYYTACESCLPEPVAPVAISASCRGQVIGVAPLFHLEYALDTSLQGAARTLTRALARVRPGILTLRLIGLGSPLAERCHLGFAGYLGSAGCAQALRCMMGALEEYAARRGIGLTVLKDVAPGEARTLGVLLKGLGYTPVQSLPAAVLELPATEGAYLAGLTRATRKGVRRKLRGASALSVETVSDIDAVAGEIDALYNSTREHSAVDYEELEALPSGYFSAVSRSLGERAVFKLYRADGQLIGFNLLLVQPDRVIDKFLGMKYPEGPLNDLYVRSWMENVSHCLQHGKRRLQTGQTAYGPKLRLGSTLEPRVIFFRHRSRVINLVLKVLAPWLAFDRNDPVLRAYRRNGSAESR
jgi:hypothetical protein